MMISQTTQVWLVAPDSVVYFTALSAACAPVAGRRWIGLPLYVHSLKPAAGHHMTAFTVCWHNVDGVRLKHDQTDTKYHSK